jgi:hypothetical protein
MQLTSDVCPTTDERVQLFALLLDTNARLARSFANVLEAKCGLALAWFDVLMQLRRSEARRLKMSEIADAIVHSSGGTTRLVDKLVEAGYVERQDCPTDRRAIYIAITPLGDAKLNEALGVHLAYLDQQLAKRLNCDERAQLTSLLSKLNDAL